MRGLPCLILPLFFAVATEAQQPAASVSLGFGVDTTIAPVGAIVRTVTAYLQLPQPGRTPTSLFVPGRYAGPALYDPAAMMAYQGFAATVVSVLPTGPRGDVYVVKLLHASAQSDSTTSTIRPLALQRLEAVPRDSAWVLRSPLSSLTASWSTHRVGRIVFHTPRGHVFGRALAARSATVLDSLQRVFSIARTAPLDYFVCGSTEECCRLLGLDFFVDASGARPGWGGRSLGPRIVLAGNPELGEAYVHEVVHAALTPAFGPTSNNLVIEGFAAWIGGSRGQPYSALLRSLVGYQERYASVTLDQILDGETARGWGDEETDASYATAALLTESVQRRLGIAGLRRWIATRPGAAAVREQLQELLGVTTAHQEAWWRAAAKERASQ